MFKRYAVPVIIFFLITGPGALDSWVSLIGKWLDGKKERTPLDLTGIGDIYQLIFPLLGLVLLMIWVWWTRTPNQIDIQQASQLDNKAVQSPANFATSDELIPSNLTGKDIRIADLVRESAVIRNRIFKDCRIFGPAAVTIRGTTAMLNCGFDTGGGDKEAILWQIANRTIFGAIALEDCILQDCQLIQIAFVGGKDMIDKILEGTTQ